MSEECDLEYTPKSDISAKKAVLKKFPTGNEHFSRSVGFVQGGGQGSSHGRRRVTDECLGPTGEVLHCPGTLCIFHNKDDKEDGQERRQMPCPPPRLALAEVVSVSGTHQGEFRRHYRCVAVLRGAENK